MTPASLLSELPLSGLRVLEIADGPAGGFCGRQFVQWGADVVLLEPAEGGPQRRLEPLWRAKGVSGSVPFAFLAAGKRSLSVSPAEAADLIGRCDVVVLDAGGLQRVKLDAPAIARRWPGVVVVCLSDFGLDGPRAGDEAQPGELEALSGYLSLNGEADGPPLVAPPSILNHAIGVNAFIGAMAGVIRRRRTGCGGLVEISGLETVAGLLPYLREQQLGAASPRQGGTVEGVRRIRCADGYVSVAPAIAPHLAAYRDALGMTENDAPESLLDGGRGAAADRAAAAFAPFAAQLPVDAVFLGLQTAGVACGIVRSPAEVLADPQLAARAFFRPHDVSPLGVLPAAGRPARLDGVGGQALMSAPQLGSTALSQLDWPAPNTVTAPLFDDAPPLRGVKVLDLTQAWIGPIAGMVLGDLGADVIKIEGPGRPDIWRYLGQAESSPGEPGSPLNRSCYFNAVNRNKRGLGLDLTRPAGAAILRRLASQADVVLENFTPRVMGRFGLAYPRIAEANPRLVMTSFSGFGANGPLAEFKTNGASIEALSGWVSLHRNPAGDPVLMASYPADPICGLQMAASTLVALYRRLDTGKGGHVEGSMLESAAEYIGDVLLAQALSQTGADISASPARPRVTGSDNAGWTLHNDPHPAIPVRDTLSALADPQLAARNWFLTLTTPGQGARLHTGYFWRFHGLAAPALTPPPLLGEHTRSILHAELELSDEAIAKLAAEGVAGAVV